MLGVGHEPELEPAQVEIELFLRWKLVVRSTECIWVIRSDGLSRSVFIIAKDA
jgi:hypothetical protein